LNVQTFAVHGSSIFAGTSGNGVFFSTDSGESWTAINNGLTASNVSCLLVTGSNLFAGPEARPRSCKRRRQLKPITGFAPRNVFALATTAPLFFWNR
jgi:hypothetical protein